MLKEMRLDKPCFLVKALALALRLAQDKVPAATKPLAAADCRDAAALEALNAAFLAE